MDLNKQGLKITIFNKTRQYNTNFLYFNVSREIKIKETNKKATASFKISNLLICLFSFDLSCPILEQDNVIEILYIVLSCLIK